MVGYSGYAKYITRTRLVTLGYGRGYAASLAPGFAESLGFARVMGLRVPKPRTCPPYFEVEELVHAVHVA